MTRFGFPSSLHKRPALAAALLAAALLPLGVTTPARADGQQNYAEPQAGNGTYDVFYNTEFGLGTYTVGNINKIISQDPGSSALDTLDGQITDSPIPIGNNNNFDWATGILELDQYPGKGTATINVPSGTTVHGEYDGLGLGFAAGIQANIGYGYSGTPALVVNNSGTVSGAVPNNDGVAAGLYSFVDFGDQYITNNTDAGITANASWYTSGIRTLSNYGDLSVNQDGSLTATSSGGTQAPYNNSGWAVGLDLQTYIGNITVTNTGTTTGSVQSVSGPNEACGAYIWADTDPSNPYYNAADPGGNMTLTNSGTFSATGANNGLVKGVYCGGNGQNVTINNSGTISSSSPTGGGWALETEIDGPGSMFINNSGMLTTNATSGLFVVSTTTGDPNSGGTGPVRIENTGTIQGSTGINSAYYNGPITVYDHSAITGTGGSAISLGNSKPDAIYVYGTPTIQGTMSAGPANSTLHLHIPAPLSSISGGNGNTDADLSNDGLGNAGSIVAGGKTYAWHNLTVSGSTAVTNMAGGVYTITNRHSALVLDEPGGETGNGTRIEQWPGNGGTNQQWQITNLGDGTYEIVNLASGRALDDRGWNTSNGAVIDVYDWLDQANQKWLFTPTDSGYFTISPADAPGSCLDVPYASTSQGVLMQLYMLADADTPPNGGQGQQWGLVPVSVPPVLTSLSPSSKVAGDKAFTLTVTGTGFAANSVVDWNGTALATTFVSSTKLTAFVSASFLHHAGTFPVTVNTPGAALSNSETFTITAAVTISSLSLSPTSVQGGAAHSTGTITLSGPAPSGGLAITQKSSDASAATLAPTLNIPAGATSAKFKITTYAVSSTQTVTITSSANGTSKTALLTVTH